MSKYKWRKIGKGYSSLKRSLCQDGLYIEKEPKDKSYIFWLIEEYNEICIDPKRAQALMDALREEGFGAEGKS